MRTQGLPAVEYSSNISAWRVVAMLPDIALLILVAAYATLAIRDVWQTLYVERKMSRAVAPDW